MTRTHAFRGFAPLATILVLLLAPQTGRGADRLLSVSPGGGTRPPDPALRIIDASDGSTIAGATVPMSLDGETVVGATGLARDPQTQTLYALLKLQGSSFRRLVILDETTGNATLIGDTGRRFAGMAFGSDGTLYAVTGDGDGVPEALYALSTSDASSTLLRELGAGSDGEAIAFNPDDGLLYHASGIGVPNHPNGEQLETVDPGNLTTQNVALSGADYEEVTALTYAGGGALLAADLGDSATDMPHLYRISTDGVVVLLGSMDHVSKGLAPVAAVPQIPGLPAPTGPPLALILAAVGARRLGAARESTRRAA